MRGVSFHGGVHVEEWIDCRVCGRCSQKTSPTLLQVVENSQISMIGYTIADFRAGDEVKGITEDEVETGEEAVRNEGHMKPHGCPPKSRSGSERIYDLIFARDWTVCIFG